MKLDTSGMRKRAMLRTILALFGVLIHGAGLAQDRPPALRPTAPGSDGPSWQRTLRLSDGRTFVTDGALMIDAAVARPATLPADALPPASASLIERHFSAQQPDEFGLSQLSRLDARVYSTPSGVHLSSTYIDFLRRTSPAARIRLRTSGSRDAVVIILDGRPVGIVMPVAR